MDGWFFVIRKVAGLYSTGGGDYAHIFTMPKPFRFLRELKGFNGTIRDERLDHPSLYPPVIARFFTAIYASAL